MQKMKLLEMTNIYKQMIEIFFNILRRKTSTGVSQIYKFEIRRFAKYTI